MTRSHFTTRQLRDDIAFLLARADGANCFSCDDDERTTGTSSNALVRFCYTGKPPRRDEAPADLSDLLACHRAYSMLPDHRRTDHAGSILHRWTETIIADGRDRCEVMAACLAAMRFGKKARLRRERRAGR